MSLIVDYTLQKQIVETILKIHYDLNKHVVSPWISPQFIERDCTITPHMPCKCWHTRDKRA